MSPSSDDIQMSNYMKDDDLTLRTLLSPSDDKKMLSYMRKEDLLILLDTAVTLWRHKVAELQEETWPHTPHSRILLSHSGKNIPFFLTFPQLCWFDRESHRLSWEYKYDKWHRVGKWCAWTWDIQNIDRRTWIENLDVTRSWNNNTKDTRL